MVANERIGLREPCTDNARHAYIAEKEHGVKERTREKREESSSCMWDQVLLQFAMGDYA